MYPGSSLHTAHTGVKEELVSRDSIARVDVGRMFGVYNEKWDNMCNGKELTV